MCSASRCRKAIVLGTSLIPVAVNAFNFTNNNPTQCDDFTVQWTGGQPPFNLLMIPPDQILRNTTIPSTAFANNAGTYTLPLPLAEHQRVIFAMSDATGVAAGGTSNLFDVGASVSGRQCNTTSPTADFFFSTDDDLFQCKSFPFNQYPNAIQPVTIIGFIPQSQPLIFHAPVGDTFVWNPVNLTAGTSIAFYMTDAQGRNGGIASIEVVRLSDDQSCMPSTSSTSASPTSTGTLQPDSTTVPKPKTGLIAGVVVGIAVLILLGAFIAIFCIRRCRRQGTSEKRRSSRKPIDPTYDQAGSPAPEGASYLMLPTQYTITPLTEPENTNITSRSRKRQLMQEESDDQSFPSGSSRSQMMSQFPPSTYTSSGAPSHFGTLGHSSDTSGMDSLANSDPTSNYKPQPRLIVHTDIAETADEPLELPPQYSEGRAPIPGLVTSDEPNAASSQGRSSRPGKGMRS